MTLRRIDLKPTRLIGDTAYVTIEVLGGMAHSEADRGGNETLSALTCHMRPKGAASVKKEPNRLLGRLAEGSHNH